jgi:hypothetical protein
VEELLRGKGTMFDPDATDVFVRAERAGDFAKLLEAGSA